MTTTMTAATAARRRASIAVAVVSGILVLILLAVGRSRAASKAVAPSSSSSSSSSRPARRALPEKVLVGYASGRYLDKVRDAVVLDGVNVVIWSFVEVIDESDDPPTVRSSLGTADLDLVRIRSLIRELDGSGFSHVVHLASLGGWNGPHLRRGTSAVDWMAAWTASDASGIFHGIDWDFEGNDVRSSPDNYFDLDLLDAMGGISRLMKEDGYVVSMAPPQSYLNFNDPTFGRYVNLTRDRGWHDDFGYFGNNLYAYLLEEYGSHVDMVSVQLYESYSDAAMSILRDGTSPYDYLYSFVRELDAENNSFPVEFGSDPALGETMGTRRVKIDPNKLVIGLANGWALNTPDKTLYVSAEDCRRAYLWLKDDANGDIAPRGFMFWTIDERGTNGVYLARGIGRFLFDDTMVE
ncbi:hypothetical protein ACHAW5_005207 [Stephanodiscus triporus]|uniref:GH18 domain-containing protein n=1 Tax=Stephanodiscus triporus TaxID=2934178 RepID=A0ABD3MWY0_9STRA